MDKGKNKKKLTEINKTFYYKLGGKNYYITNKYSGGLYMDSNTSGNLFFGEDNEFRNLSRKWVFINTDTPGNYYIKNLSSDLFLTSTENGDLFTTKEDKDSSFQRWGVFNTSDNLYVIQSICNQFVLSCTKRNQMLIIKLDPKYLTDCPTKILFDIFSFKPKK
jgi:hypothetical protein